MFHCFAILTVAAWQDIIEVDGMGWDGGVDEDDWDW